MPSSYTGGEILTLHKIKMISIFQKKKERICKFWKNEKAAIKKNVKYSEIPKRFGPNDFQFDIIFVEEEE